MPVASVSTHTVTLDSDPGYSANAYRERLLQIVSGTGASNQDGNPKPIRSHNGVDFVIVGQWDTPPDATSVVRIVEPACKIVVDDWYIPIAASGQNFEDVYSPALQIDGIEFAAATGQITLLATGGLIVLKNAIVNGGVLSESGNLGLRGAVVFSGGGGWTPGIWTIGGTIIDGGSVDAVLIRNNLYGGVIASAAKGATRIHLSNCAIDDVPDCISSDAHDILISLHARLQSSGCSGYGVKMLNNKATNVRLHTSWLASPYGLRGTLGELNLNGAVATYAELAAASEATLINGQCVVQGVTV